jgi:hypothetical protein
VEAKAAATPKVRVGTGTLAPCDGATRVVPIPPSFAYHHHRHTACRKGRAKTKRRYVHVGVEVGEGWRGWWWQRRGNGIVFPCLLSLTCPLLYSLDYPAPGSGLLVLVLVLLQVLLSLPHV